jgi:hypothetical protein
MEGEREETVQWKLDMKGNIVGPETTWKTNILVMVAIRARG